MFFKVLLFYLFVHRGPGQVARMIISGCLLDLLLGLVGACSLKFHVQTFTNKSRNINFLEFALVGACSLEFHVQPFYESRNIKFLEFGVFCACSLDVREYQQAQKIRKSTITVHQVVRVWS